MEPILMDVPDVDIPDGWDLLPGGVERIIAYHPRYKDGESFVRPWRVEVDGRRVAVLSEFRALGEVRSVLVSRLVWFYRGNTCTSEPCQVVRLATTAPILVRY